MTERELRQKAAELARECRAIKSTDAWWTIRRRNHSVRMTIRHYMSNTRRFCRVHDMWEEQ
jgi:hypothetical protein